MAGIPPVLPPQPPARKRSMNALTASLPPLPKAPRLDVPTTSRGSSERSADHSDADDRHYEEARGRNASPARQSPERTDLEDRQASGPNQKAVYCAAFKLHFGVPSDGEPYFADFCAIQTGISTGRTVWAESKKLCDDIWRAYDYQKSYFCCLCDRLLANHRAFCSHEECRLRGVTPKRAQDLKRISVHSISIAPQFDIILKRVIDSLISVHRRIHNRSTGSVRHNVSDFPAYERDIESDEEFASKKIRVVLTMNFDGVPFNKLTRSQAWPIYIRLEGLPFNMKNDPENMILPAITFLRKTPTEELLRSLFSRLKEELRTLKEGGVRVQDSTRTVWTCYRQILNGVIDFAGMRTIYKCPRWLSDQGCHLCIAKGERMGRSVSWCITAPSIWNKRTHASILRDAEANQNGLGGLTQMMDFFTMERCRVDALHALSEGVSCDLFREMLSPKRRVPELKISTASKKLLSEALESARNYTYAAKFVLGLKDLSKCTASEKDAIMFLMFPLVATKRMCADDCGSSCVLIYWALVRSLQKSSELTSETMSRIRELANALKSLWRSVSKQLFTLKLHCVIDHSCLEDLQDVGTAYQWSAEGFEKMHRTLQLRHSQSATNCEELLMKNFVLRRELNELLRIEICRSAEPCCSRLYQKIQGDAVKRFPALVRLTSGWYIPTNSEIRDVRPEHAGEIQRLLCQQYNLSSRLCYASKVYTSHYYWTRKKDTRSDVLYLNVNGNAMFGSVVLFAYEAHGECVVLLEELVTDDPFAGLFSELRTSQHQACLQAVVATDTVRRYNNFFCKNGRRFLLSEWRYRKLDGCSVDPETYPGPSARSSQCTASSSSSWSSSQERLVVEDGSDVSPTFEGGSNVETSSASDYANAILRTKPLSLADVGELALRSSDFECEQIVANRLKDPRVSLSELKDIQMAVKHLPPSSDTVVQSMQELLLKTCSIATGLAMVLDHVLVNTASLRTDIAQTSAHMHVLARLKLPDDTVLSHLNLTKRWTIAASPPFKEKDLKSLMTHWKIPARADKRDHVTHCTDFARMYFATACDPVEDVKKYAVRVSGKHTKDPRKMDLPADIKDTLIKCFLDGLKMGQPELDRMPYELAAQPTQFWLDLGPTNETRAAKLLERQAARDAWTSALKSALGRALNNVRQYIKKGSALVPKKKNSRNAND